MAPTNLLIRASAAIVKSSRSEIGEAEGWNKTMKLIRRILDNALADGGVESLRLVLELMEGGEKWQVLLTEETVQLARNIGLGKVFETIGEGGDEKFNELPISTLPLSSK